MENLPVEIFHRIFNHLDIETIFFSIRPVCRSFRSIVLNYDRLDFHLKLSSKAHFDVLCRLIPPENIRSLTLYNNERIPDQISPFLRQVHLRELTRLHSIDLDGIDEFQLNYLFQRISVDLLRSFSIQMKSYGDKRTETTVSHLSTVVKQSNLRNLHLNTPYYQPSEISWPMNCSIECLTINKNISLHNLVQIFSCSPQLHQLVMKSPFIQWNMDNGKGHSFIQLKSLILEDLNSTIDELESFLCLTASLCSLKLVGTVDRFDGKRWEDFVQVNLPHLNQFKFDLFCRDMMEKTQQDLERILQSFRSEFWIEQKKWFITMKFNDQLSNKIEIYSIPIGKTIHEIQFISQNRILSTLNERYENKEVTEMRLRFLSSLSETTLVSMNIFDCPKITKLCLHFGQGLSNDLIKFSLRIINLPRLLEVEFDILCFNDENQRVLCDIFKLLEQSSKLSILSIRVGFCYYDIYAYLNGIISNLPPQINHLHIPLEQVTQIQTIFQRCLHLKVIQFQPMSRRTSKATERWFGENTIGSIFRRIERCDTIWIETIKQQNHLHHQRIKANDDHS